MSPDDIAALALLTIALVLTVAAWFSRRAAAQADALDARIEELLEQQFQREVDQALAVTRPLDDRPSA